MRDVSLVVPVRNEERTIQGLIDSISLQTVLPREAIFVDGGSKDDTKKIIKDNIGKASFRIKLIELESAFPGEGRNRGVKESDFDLIAFTDAGIKLDRKWLEGLLRPIEEDSAIDCVYGAYEPVVDSFIKECSLIAYVPPKEAAGGKMFRTNFIASSLFKKKVFENAGGFPPFRAAEDKIFMDRVKSFGANIFYTDKAKVYWEIPDSIIGIFNRFREFSTHDILAGRSRDWHYSVFRLYGVMSLLLFLGFSINPLFLWGIAGLVVMRIAKILYRHRLDLKPQFFLDPKYIPTILLIVLVTDIAMFLGTIRYVMRYVKSAPIPKISKVR